MELTGTAVLLCVLVGGAVSYDPNYMSGYDPVLRRYVQVPTDLLADEGAGLRSRRATAPSTRVPAHWPRLYVKRGGLITNHTDNEFDNVLVVSTPETKRAALERAAKMVAIETGHMHQTVWNNLVHGGVTLGVYGHEEKLTEFPTFKGMASRDCDHSCSGSCRGTCASLGRKIEDLVGIGGHGIAVVGEDNVLCTDFDTYRKGESILMHEFGHTIQTGLPHDLQAIWTKAYQRAVSVPMWTPGSYALSNEHEFWAEATQVWFGVTLDNRSFAAGMNLCHGVGVVCKEGTNEGQLYIKSIQPEVYDVLNQVYNSGDASISHGADLCPPGSGVDWSYH